MTEDAEWINYAAEHDLVVLCKDDWIRRRPLERRAMQRGGVRVFCLTNANLTLISKLRGLFDTASGSFSGLADLVRMYMASTRMGCASCGRPNRRQLH